MADKKKTAARTAVSARRVYTEGNAAQCSVEKKRTGVDQAPRAQPNKATFVHKKASGQDEVKSGIDLKNLNPKQKACHAWFGRVMEKGLREIRREFLLKLKNYKSDSSIDSFTDEANALKNRYDDVYLLDKTRVKVKINPDKDDYIHASYVEVRPNDLTYICAQGPLENTIHQFWLMCIQEGVKVILQLCRNSENDIEKCADYLPKDSDWTSFGPVQVKILKPGASVSNTKKVVKTVVQCKFNDKEHTLTHILYHGWPDHDVPESIPTCREVRKLVHKLHEKKPVVAHCSAGIGRTGTFVAIDMVCNKLLNEHDADLDMVELIQGLRNQRARAIQNDQQYSYIFRGVADILIAEDGLTKTSEVIEFFQSFDDMIARKRKPAKGIIRKTKRARN